MSNVGYATVTIIPSAKGFKRNLDKEISPAIAATGGRGGDAAGKAAGRKFTPAFLPALGKFATVGAVAGGAAIGLGIATGLKGAAFLQQAEISFTTLLGSGGKAQSMISDLSAFAAKTPFDLPGVVSSARSLIGTGTAAADVIPTLNSLGDATAALGLSSENYGSIVRAVTQIQSKGKFQAEEALQIAEAGIPIYPLLAKAMGKTVPEIQKMMSEGKLLAEDALPALYAQMDKDYGGAMIKQSETLSGVWSTVQDTISMALADALLPLAPVLAKVLPPAADALASAITAVSDGIAGLEPIVRPAIDALKGLFSGDAGGGGMLTSLMETGESLRTFFQGLAGPITAQIDKIRAVVGPGLAMISDTISNTFLPAFRSILPIIQPVAAFIIDVLGSAISGALSGAMKVINGVLTAISGVFKVFSSVLKGDWSGAWEGVKQIVSGVFEGIIGAVQVWLNVGILGIFKKGALAIVGAFKGLWTGLKGAASSGISSVTGFFSKGFSAIGNLIKSAVMGYLNFWKSLFNGLKSAATAGWNALRSAFGGALSAIRTAVSSAMSSVRSTFSSAMTSINSAVSSGISKVVSTVRGLPGKALSALGAIGSKLYSAGRDLIAGFIRGIKNAAGGIVSAIASTITDKIPSFVKKALGIRSPSRVFMGIGANVSEGMAKGISGKASLVESAADSLAYIPNVDGPSVARRAAFSGLAAGASQAAPTIHVEISARDLEGLRSVEDFVQMLTVRQRMIQGV